jgi:tRNA (guanine37-N1)-methyltransferase
VRIDLFTIFPEMLETWMGQSLIGKARREGVLDIRVHDLRSEATDPHRSVDDSPFGGGAGMVLAPGPIFGAVEAADPPRPLIYLSPAGRRLDQAEVRRLAGLPGFSLLCGRYEGVDQRVLDHLVDEELSIGDYVLPGGESAAVVVAEAVARLFPGVMGNNASAGEESFADNLLEYPQYTRPARYRDWPVPEVLLSGDHGRVAAWRRSQSLGRTLERRPDLAAARGGISAEEVRLLGRGDYPGSSPGAAQGAPGAPDDRDRAEPEEPQPS